MKLKLKLPIFFLSLVSLVLSACVDENLSVDEDGKETWQQGDVPYYINIKLNTQDGNFTRADWESPSPGSGFENGSHFDEHAIGKKGNFAIFFDKNKKYISWADLYSVNETGVDGTENSPKPEAIYSCRFYGFADSEPKYVLVVVNASDKIYKQVTSFPGWTVDEVYKQIWEESARYGEEDEEIEFYNPENHLGLRIEENGIYFTMTNTAYVVNAGSSSAEVHCAEMIPEECITTEPEAVERLRPVTIYLERMVAKCQLNEITIDHNNYIPPGASSLDVLKYDDDGNQIHMDYPWGLQILGWGMNGLETQNFLFKNLEPTGDWLTHTGWNSVYNKRSYWSFDPHYIKDPTGETVYPWQYDDAKDQYDSDNQRYYSHFQSYDRLEKKFALSYYPFYKFCPDFDDEKTGYFIEGYKYYPDFKPVYVPENTFKPGLTIDRSRGSRAYELAGTHVLICARLLLPDEETGLNFKPFIGKDLYRNRVGVTYIDEYSMLVDFINAVNYKLRSSTELYYKYYEWNSKKTSKYKTNSEKGGGIDNYRGYTMRAITGGEMALYCHFPNINPDNGGTIMELTPATIKYFLSSENNNNEQYVFTREADAVNADGKIIPWIMEKQSNGSYEPLKLMILRKNDDAKDNEKLSSNDTKKKPYLHYDENSDTEYITGDPEDDGTIEDYLYDRKLTFEKLKNGSWIKYNRPAKDERDNEQVERDDNDIQSLFFEIWGVADCFHNGLMYYAVPIYAQDSGSASTLYKAIDYGAEVELDANEDLRNEEKLKYYYGVVRNNWYQFSLHSITDIGIPVFNPFKPIVPNYLNKKDQTKVEMEILQWHIEDQTVEIPFP